MIENPYQSPNADPPESTLPKHQSFRLTQGSTSADARGTSGTFRDAIKFSLMQQLPLLLLSSMILDGELIFKRVGIASVAFWILTLVIMVRRGENTTDSDILMVKWGYLPILLTTCILWMVGSAIMF